MPPEKSSKKVKRTLDFFRHMVYYNQADCRQQSPPLSVKPGIVGTMKWRSRVAGRARTIGNRVYPKRVSRVQIPPSPPKQDCYFR